MIALVILIKQRGIPVLNSPYGRSDTKHNEPYVLRTRPNVGEYVDT